MSAPMPSGAGPVVFKFGGTSVGDAARIRHVAGVVEAWCTAHGAPPVVVVSAVGEVTDHLMELLAAPPETRGARLEEIAAFHRSLMAELTGGTEATDASESPAPADAPGDALEAAVARARAALAELDDPALLPAAADVLLALGEDLSSLAVTAALMARGVPARRVDAREVVRTDDRFGFARPDEEAVPALARARILPLLEAGEVPVLQGFVGAASDGRTTTLGRGGSDLTATLLGAALEAREVHIWTDVEGILSADPRLVPEARVLEVVGFEEAVELAYFGARVMHAGAAKQAVARGVPVRVRSTFTPERPGTLILRDRWGGPTIAAVAVKPTVSLIKVRARRTAIPYGFLARVFEILARHRLPVDLVATSHTSTAFTVDEAEEIREVARELEELAEVEVRTGLATVTVVGYGLLREPGFDARVFGTVGRTPVHLVSQASDVSLSFVVDGGDASRLVRQLHAELVEPRPGTAPAGGDR
ncbi:MAG TPA: aspartate kinase [Longimicrobiales bacterium]|nr:aspartate kinase [Longimicrobiales bacterium]